MVCNVFGSPRLINEAGCTVLFVSSVTGGEVTAPLLFLLFLAFFAGGEVSPILPPEKYHIS